MKLVAGLGNPGSRYSRTRHNLGFWVVDSLAREAGLCFGRSPFLAEVASGSLAGERVVLAKPQTYMNLSGNAVGPLARWYKVEPPDILVVCDDMDLPVGRIRAREGGGDGGHKGLKSVTEDLGTEKVPRLRIGVGRPARSAEDWVLTALKEEEEERFKEIAARAVDAVEIWIRDGIETCMNRFNVSEIP